MEKELVKKPLEEAEILRKKVARRKIIGASAY